MAARVNFPQNPSSVRPRRQRPRPGRSPLPQSNLRERHASPPRRPNDGSGTDRYAAQDDPIEAPAPTRVDPIAQSAGPEADRRQSWLGDIYRNEHASMPDKQAALYRYALANECV